MAVILPFRGIMPKIAPDAFVAENAVIIGDVEIGPGSSVWYGCVIRGDSNKIRIGRDTNLQDGTVVHVNHDPEGDYRETGGGMATHIGDGVVIGHMALIHACTLESGSFLGMRSVVMDQAVVEGRSMVAAGALVAPSKRVRAGELWVGSPARRARELNERELATIPYLAEHYRDLGARYLAEREAEG